ncbi:methyltransferase domain-containing protein [Paenibacillus filicis]|uniref:Methyltransferase domain-containing protein n=1 Tax=Paenibacillus gyeongsangnamensis TaxID=3388067 RepID=A0ABT4QG65_9BACL|nr:class I SAM-dependent methyltransferase [Paenibacillus filicis]MCZ8515803.1 methyltransferase domain-containing protein [Paenibacillus filicis]
MGLIFPDIYQHPEYLKGQTRAWCNQLATQTGKYEYTWNYTCEGVAAEDVFTEELSKLIRGNVLDVGCGHGEYTNRWADQADEVIGYDMTEGFLATANRNSKSNVRYVLGYTHNDGLPFADRYFNVAYTKKGPGSWYPDVNRILKSEADVLSLHPADGNGEGCELGTYFPGLFFPPTKGTPILNKINAYLADSRLHVIENHILRETIYIPTPEDILTMVCFGQSERFAQFVKETCFDGIQMQFEHYASDKGVHTTNFYYLIRAKATG